MITSPHDNEVTCAVCQQRAVRRQIKFKGSSGAVRAYYYDCHDSNHRSATHRSRVDEVDDILEVCDQIEAAFVALSQEERGLTPGGHVVKVDLIPLIAEACAQHEKVRFYASVRAYAQSRDVECSAEVKAQGLTAKKVMTEIKAECNAEAARMKAAFDGGNF